MRRKPECVESWRCDCGEVYGERVSEAKPLGSRGWGEIHKCDWPGCDTFVCAMCHKTIKVGIMVENRDFECVSGLAVCQEHWSVGTALDSVLEKSRILRNLSREITKREKGEVEAPDPCERLAALAAGKAE